MSQGSSTQTSNNAPPPQFTAAYSNAVQQAQNVASVPYQAYPGQTVAGLSPDQMGAINETENAQGIANPYINAGAQYINQATTPLWGETQQFSPANVQQYESPYTSQVVNATQQQFNNQNAIQQQGVVGNAISNGAFGGDRTAVAQGIVAGQQQANQAPVIAGLENQGYAQALGEFNTQQQAQIGANEANSWLNSQAGYGMANLGQEALNSQLTGASALAGVGGLEQSQAQANLNAPYQQFLAAQAYPFQTTGWEANIAEGLGGASGGSSSSTAPSNTAGQIAGAGLTGLGTLGVTGAFGQNGYLTGANGLFSSGNGAAASAVDDSFGADTAATGAGYDMSGFGASAPTARGGAIQSRAPGGGISGFPAPSLTSVAPDVSVGIVPGADGMGDAPATHGTPDILKNYGTTSTTSGGPNTTLGMIGGLAGGIAGSFFGGTAGGFLGSQAGHAVGSALNDGGIVANDNDHWHEPERHRAVGGITPPMLPTNNPQVSTFTGNYGIPIPQLTGAGGGGGPQLATVNGGIVPTTGSGALDSYLGGQSQGAYHASPISYTPPPPPPAAPTDGLTPEGIAYANTAAANAILNAAGSSNGGAEWRGGRVRRDDGGGIAADPDLEAGVFNNESSSRMVPGIVGDNGQAGGPMQVHQAALTDVNARLGTHYSFNDMVSDPHVGKLVGDTYLGMMQERFHDPAMAAGAYNAGPGAMQHAIDSGQGIAGLPASAQAYAARATGAHGEQGDAGNVGAAGPPGAAGIAPPPADASTDDASGVAAPQHVGMGPWGAVLAAGLGTLAHNGNIGRGGMEGLQVAENEAKMDAQERDRQATMQSTTVQRQETNRHNVVDEAHAAQQLSVQADDAKARLAQSGQTHQDEVDYRNRSLAQQEQLRTDALVPPEVREAQWFKNASPADQAAYRSQQYLKKDLTDPFGQPTGAAPPNTNGAAPAATGEEFLKTVNPTLQPQIKALAEGRLAMPTRPSPQQQQLIQLTGQYDPTFDATDYNKRNRTASDFSPAGKSGQALQFINNALSHAAKLSDQAPDMPGQSSSDLINTPVNWLSQHVMGNATPVNVAQTRDALANEMRKVFATSGGGGLEELRSWEQSFPVNGSPAQIQSAVKNAIELMEPRLNGLGHAFTQGMGTNHSGFDLLPDTGKQAYQKIMGGVPETVNVRTPTYNQPTQATPQQPIHEAPAVPPSWKYSATGPGGAMVHSNDGRAWFTPDGKPYAP